MRPVIRYSVGLHEMQMPSIYCVPGAWLSCTRYIVLVHFFRLLVM